MSKRTSLTTISTILIRLVTLLLSKTQPASVGTLLVVATSQAGTYAAAISPGDLQNLINRCRHPVTTKDKSTTAELEARGSHTLAYDDEQAVVLEVPRDLLGDYPGIRFRATGVQAWCVQLLPGISPPYFQWYQSIPHRSRDGPFVLVMLSPELLHL